MNLRLNRETDLIWICMGAVVFTLLLPWILGAGPSSPEFEDRKREIENMSADERQQLEANFEAYKKSQQYLRDEYRKLHEAVDADSELLSLLNEYCELVKTLRPEQRDELKRTHDPHERLILVGTALRCRISLPPRSASVGSRQFASLCISDHRVSGSGRKTLEAGNRSGRLGSRRMAGTQFERRES